MKYKQFISLSGTLAFCFFIFLPSIAPAQTASRRRKPAAKTAVKSKNITAAQSKLTKSKKPVSKEAMIIGINNPVLINPVTKVAVTKPVSGDIPKQVAMGIINSKAVNLVKPIYPPAAKAVNAAGAVNVQVTIDEQGNVLSANSISGHPLLRSAAEQAAQASKFTQTQLNGQPVKVTGIIVYNFVAP